MKQRLRRWLSLGSAAELYGASPDTIGRRAVRWSVEPVAGKLRWKFLQLGQETRRERRFILDDVTKCQIGGSGLPIMDGSMKVDLNRWLSLTAAAAYLDVSPDTIKRRRIEWCDEPVDGSIRWKWLKLGTSGRLQRRYFMDDLDGLLVIA